jgi:hypothetical protein
MLVETESKQPVFSHLDRTGDAVLDARPMDIIRDAATEGEGSECSKPFDSSFELWFLSGRRFCVWYEPSRGEACDVDREVVCLFAARESVSSIIFSRLLCSAAMRRFLPSLHSV